MARLFTAVLCLVATLAAASASPPLAGGTLTPAGAPLLANAQGVAGPSFAGDAIAWAVPRGRENIDVHLLSKAGDNVQRVQSLGGGPPRFFVHQALAASPQVVALAVNVQSCAGDCKYMDFNTEESAVHAGNAGGPLARIGGCSSGNASVDVSGSALAYVDECATASVVRDLSAPPGSPWLGFPIGATVRIAGDYVAVDPYEAGADTIAVYNWRTGQRLYELPRPAAAYQFDLQDDGTIAFVRGLPAKQPTSYELAWASPAEPYPHRIASVADGFAVRIADSKVAVRDWPQFHVYDLAGHELAATSSTEAIGGMDFDGSRLAMAVQPCEEAAIVTWDLVGEPPQMPAGRCPHGVLTERVSTADLRHRRVIVHAACPKTGGLGCSGDWVVGFDRPAIIGTDRFVALRPGGKVTLRLPLSRREACKIGHVRLVRAHIWMDATDTKRPAAPGGRLKLKLRRVGRPTGCK